MKFSTLVLVLLPFLFMPPALADDTLKIDTILKHDFDNFEKHPFSVTPSRKTRL